MKMQVLKNVKVYICEECGMKYYKKEVAKECEEWCKKNHTCNIEIIKKAIKK